MAENGPNVYCTQTKRNKVECAQTILKKYTDSLKLLHYCLIQQIAKITIIIVNKIKWVSKSFGCGEGAENIPKKNMLPGLFRLPRVRSGVSRGKVIAKIPISQPNIRFSPCK